MPASSDHHVVIVGAGFAGLASALALAKAGAKVTLLDRENYHQFRPLLYQVATAQLGSTDIAYPIRSIVRRHPNVTVRVAEAVAVDPQTRTVVTNHDGHHQGDDVIIAAGSRVNFLGTPGAAEHAIPLYTLNDALRLRSRIIGLFESADRNPEHIDDGALRFVIVGGGATGVETAGALAEMVRRTMAVEYPDLAVDRAEIILVNHGTELLSAFAPRSHAYAARYLEQDGVTLRLGVGVTEVGAGHVSLSDGTTLRTRCVIWAAGVQAESIAANAGLPVGRGGRVDIREDLTVEGFPGIWVVGDAANTPGPDGHALPQLGGVAEQAGKHIAKSILAIAKGHPVEPFHYLDKGAMAMIGRGAAIMDTPGSTQHELQGPAAVAAWLGVHAALMSGYRNRVNAFVDWGAGYLGGGHTTQVLDRTDAARIDWSEDAASADPAPPAADPAPPAADPAPPAA